MCNFLRVKVEAAVPAIAVFPKPFARWPRLASNVTTDPHIFARLNMVWPCDRNPEFKICVIELILDGYEYKQVAYVKMHCMIWP
jgi:hypothetical protein